MKLPPIDIDALPLLDTSVGLFGSVVNESMAADASMFEVLVTMSLIASD